MCTTSSVFICRSCTGSWGWMDIPVVYRLPEDRLLDFSTESRLRLLFQLCNQFLAEALKNGLHSLHRVTRSQKKNWVCCGEKKTCCQLHSQKAWLPKAQRFFSPVPRPVCHLRRLALGQVLPVVTEGPAHLHRSATCGRKYLLNRGVTCHLKSI